MSGHDQCPLFKDGQSRKTHFRCCQNAKLCGPGQGDGHAVKQMGFRRVRKARATLRYAEQHLCRYRQAHVTSLPLLCQIAAAAAVAAAAKWKLELASYHLAKPLTAEACCSVVAPPQLSGLYLNPSHLMYTMAAQHEDARLPGHCRHLQG